MTYLEMAMKAASSKFGEVYSIGKHDTGDFVLMIRRDDPANTYLPYMTIRATVSVHGSVSFYHGYYDMSEFDACTSFRERTAFSQQCF